MASQRQKLAFCRSCRSFLRYKRFIHDFRGREKKKKIHPNNWKIFPATPAELTLTLSLNRVITPFFTLKLLITLQEKLLQTPKNSCKIPQNSCGVDSNSKSLVAKTSSQRLLNYRMKGGLGGTVLGFMGMDCKWVKKKRPLVIKSRRTNKMSLH